MSHIAPSDSEDPDATDELHYKKSKSHGAKDHTASSYFTSEATIDENLSEASGGRTVSKDSLRVKDRFDYKKQARNLENYENNNPGPTNYGATAAITTTTDMETETLTDTRQTIIREQRSESQSATVDRPRPPIQQPQQQNQNEPRGDQNERNGAPPLGDDGDPRLGPGHGQWKEKCRKFFRHVRFACIFVVLLIFCAGVVSIVVWLTVVNKQNTEPQVTYANLFEKRFEKLGGAGGETKWNEYFGHPKDNLRPTKGGADVKVNLTGRVDPNFEEANFHLSLYRGSCVSPSPNQTLSTSGRAENYQILGENADVSHHVIMLGSSAELNVSFVLSNSTLMNDANFKVYFFKSYEDLQKCNHSEPDETSKNCPCSFFIPTTDVPSFNYANGSYGYNVDCQKKPFAGQHYFLTKFLGVRGSPNIYNHLFVNFTFRYSTTGVFDPLATNFIGQKCKSLDDTDDKIHEYICGVNYGSIFLAGRSMCTYLTLTTPYIAAEIDSRFRDIFPVTITERHRDDVMFYIAGVVVLVILLLLTAYCAPCRLILKTVRNGYVHRAYHALN